MKSTTPPIKAAGYAGPWLENNWITASEVKLYGNTSKIYGGSGSGSASPRTEVVHALINAHNPPNYPHSAMKPKGFPFSCAASSFCGGALRVGDYKLLVPHAAFVCVSEKFCTHWD